MTDATAADTAAAAGYFDRSVRAFETFDAARVADLSAVPGVPLRRDDSLAGLASRGNVERYYQAALDRYRRDGCASCRWSGLAVVPTSRRGLLAAVTWDLLREDGTVLVRWRQSYCLNLSGDNGPRTFASAMHAE